MMNVNDIKNRVLNLRLPDAVAFIAANGCYSRVISADGLQYDGTTDHKFNRINLVLIDGIVREASVG